MSLFDDILKYEDRPSSTTVKPVNAAKPASPKPQAAKAMPQAKGKPDPHKHPAAANATVQKVDYVQYDSEGCPQHYNDRFVADDQYLISTKTVMDYSTIINSFVLGEALLTPRFKKPWRPK